MNAVFCCLALLSPAPTAGGEDLLRAIAAAYDENRAKFSQCRAEVRVRNGTAKQVDAARSGTLLNASEARGSYRYIPGHWLYEFRYSQADMASTTVKQAKGGIRVSLPSSAFLADNNHSLVVRIIPSLDLKGTNPIANLTPGQNAYFRGTTVPLALGAPDSCRDDLASDIRSALLGGAIKVESVEEHAKLDGREVVKVVISRTEDQRDYWVDVERGAIPLRMTSRAKAGGVPIDIYFDDLKQVPGRGWFPMTRTLWSEVGGTIRLELINPDWETPSAPQDFRLEFDKPIRVSDQPQMLEYGPRKVWDLSDLPKMGSKEVARVLDAPEPTSPAMLREREASGVSSYMMIGGLLVISAVVGFVITRRRR